MFQPNTSECAYCARGRIELVHKVYETPCYTVLNVFKQKLDLSFFSTGSSEKSRIKLSLSIRLTKVNESVVKA